MYAVQLIFGKSSSCDFDAALWIRQPQPLALALPWCFLRWHLVRLATFEVGIR